ncbi:uncharacterized protein SPSK_05382 [Sporothrix schenckii 1099-18]|uniref:Uncharacterized protein n=1 Tax=Sporothrix schenckii 1099-18 TaxID=1397361 RepID=A0A0F2LZ13_SPOSC|nr:uncharacterized protein SPSK_05382 [Sporothrix schenckii 1099-18]KJR81131.1 hypothetical protein SPSK_05382 [Sporothrix schenckii 1099-18]
MPNNYDSDGAHSTPVPTALNNVRRPAQSLHTKWIADERLAEDTTNKGTGQQEREDGEGRQGLFPETAYMPELLADQEQWRRRRKDAKQNEGELRKANKAKDSAKKSWSPTGGESSEKSRAEHNSKQASQESSESDNEQASKHQVQAPRNEPGSTRTLGDQPSSQCLAAKVAHKKEATKEGKGDKKVLTLSAHGIDCRSKCGWPAESIVLVV